MARLVESASLTEFAALAQMELLRAEDISAYCMRLLEEDLDEGDALIAAFAGSRNPTSAEAGPAVSRILKLRGVRELSRNEATLWALRLHLAVALANADIVEGLSPVIERFGTLDTERLVTHPRRAPDHPDATYASEELGLEYIYGNFYAYDEIEFYRVPFEEQKALRARCLMNLRNGATELHEHLSTVLGA